ncbi:MAG: hypothetical protein KUL86_10300 [Castellaniella sp.]|nr:hypothetical protein [Castellaniella sp.]
MNSQILNARTPGTTLWRFHGYRKSAAGFVCEVITPDGTHIHEPLALFVRNVSGRDEWDNDPEDIAAMLELARVRGMRHE